MTNSETSWTDKEAQARFLALCAEDKERKASGRPWPWEQSIDERPVELLTYNDEYLHTKLWKRIKRRVLKRDSHQCRCCRGKATIVHHRGYARDVLAGMNDEQLASICEGCHNFIHFDDSGARRTPEETDLLLLKGRHDTDFPAPKVDLRRKWRQYPAEWPRMNAVQRSAWEMEYHRVWLLRRLSKVRDKQPQAEIY